MFKMNLNLDHSSDSLKKKKKTPLVVASAVEFFQQIQECLFEFRWVYILLQHGQL